MNIRSEIAAERRALAGLLGDLPAARWEEPTLCAGWRVREVVAHITMAYRHSLPRVLFGLIRAKGDINWMLDRYAREDAAALSPESLAAGLRDNAEHPWRPPGGGYEGALTHDVTHGLDITVALGIDRRVPADRLRIVLDAIDPRKVRGFFGVDLDGIELRADDMDWSLGSGVPMYGAAQDLLLAAFGRKLPRDRLRGEPRTRFTVA
jgi:uncharacterized protein (TIGR03083 family)